MGKHSFRVESIAGITIYNFKSKKMHLTFQLPAIEDFTLEGAGM
ncbi:hypothetical protein BO1005MUT1_320125 [Hyphomicrobiales bacterium]|nr:hypothetical protein BO1005MUT1_320125 [Hyphomicrobiales bacterium]